MDFEQLRREIEQIMPTPARRLVFAEAVGIEDFVPWQGDYARSQAILEQAARWFDDGAMPEAP